MQNRLTLATGTSDSAEIGRKSSRKWTKIWRSKICSKASSTFSRNSITTCSCVLCSVELSNDSKFRPWRPTETRISRMKRRHWRSNPFSSLTRNNFEWIISSFQEYFTLVDENKIEPFRAGPAVTLQDPFELNVCITGCVSHLNIKRWQTFCEMAVEEIGKEDQGKKKA